MMGASILPPWLSRCASSMSLVSHRKSRPSVSILNASQRNSERAVVGVQCPVDDRRDKPLGVMSTEGLLDDALAGSWFAHDDTEAALLAMDAKRVENDLLLR